MFSHNSLGSGEENHRVEIVSLHCIQACVVSIRFIPGDVEADLLIMWCLPGFSTENLLFSPFLTVFTEEGHEVRPTFNGRGKKAHFLEGKLSTYVVWNF